MSSVKFYNRWDAGGATVQDLGLQRYITIQPKIIPKTGARYAGSRFHKSQTFIVERLASKLMSSGHKGKKHFISSGHNTGKKSKALEVVEQSLAIVEKKINKNPLA